MTNRQDADELQVFRLFVESAQLAVSTESIQKRQSPEPDIRCELDDHGSICFELVEIVDSDLARAVGNQITFQQRLWEAAKAEKLGGLSDGLVFVRFAPASTSEQRNAAIPGLMTLLSGLPGGFRGDAILTKDPPFAEVVQRVRVTRGDFVGPCFQVDGGTFISDPIVERIEGKFKKRYVTSNRLELLAFYDLHPTARAEYQLPAVETFVRQNLQSSQFSRVWVFDVENRAVLYSS